MVVDLVAAFLEGQLPVQRLAGIQLLADAQVEAAEPLAVAKIAAVRLVVEAVVLLPRQRQAQVAALPALAVAGVPVVDAALAMGYLQARAVAVAGGAGEDVDDRHQRIGAVADRIGAAEHLDALDVLDGHRNVGPVDLGEAGAVHRAAIDQHLQAAGLVGAAAVVVDGCAVAILRHHQHAGHQTQQFGQAARTAGADQRAVEHADAARDCRRGLLQAGSGEDLGQRRGGQEQILGEGCSGGQGAQQGRQRYAQGDSHCRTPDSVGGGMLTEARPFASVQVSHRTGRPAVAPYNAAIAAWRPDMD
ncbi:hypothetical protein D3C80_1172320 [compost metagenome]